MIGTARDDAFGFLNTPIRQGRFAAAFELLEHHRGIRRADRLNFDILWSELAIELGQTALALEAANRCLEGQDLHPEFRIRLQIVQATAAFYQGDVRRTLDTLAQALRESEECSSKVLRAQVALFDFAVGLNVLPIETALTRLADVRKAVLRVADPHLLVLLRIAVARAEARRHSPREAKRHHQAGLSLLAGDPNLWLEGLVHIDMAVIAMVLGELSESLLYAQRALELAEQSGHARTKVAAVINIAQLFTWRGDLVTAKRYVTKSLEIADGNRHLMRSALDSWANLLITSGQYIESQAVFDRLFKEHDVSPDSRPHWDAASEVFSRARLAQAEGDLNQSITLLDQALAIAQNSGDQLWVRRIRASRAHCFGRLGLAGDAIADLDELHKADLRDPDLLSRYCAALAAYYKGRQRPRAASEHLRRALRIGAGIENQALCKDITSALMPLEVDAEPLEGRRSWGTPMESACVLLELGAHPHILGVEAFAVLKESGSTKAAALGARGRRGVRIVEKDQWSESEALARFSKSTPADAIVLGQHGDEVWELLAEPGVDLEHRCTFAAFRKILEAASALDQYRRDEKQRAALWPAESLEGDTESLWVSEQSVELVRLARRLASSPLPILITGETGTGKEMLARVIHRAGNRAERPLVPVNCTAVPREMLESQLFGYRRGAFTGAEVAFTGVIRGASGGTLFLDEIGDMNIELQPKLLRFIEHAEVHPLGEAQAVKVDVRIIAATNANLETLVSQGRFREDLLYRLKTLALHLPPLRERREEIPALLQHYLQKCGDEQRKGRLTLSDETLEYLLLYSWPGNIRQLANEVRRMTALAEPDATLTPALLSPEIQASRRTLPAGDAPAEPEMRVRLDQPLPAAVDALEQTLVRHALQRSQGRVEEAARMLGISRKGLFLKRRRWGLQQAS